MEKNNKRNFDYYLYLYYKLLDSFKNFNKVIEKENDFQTKLLQVNQKYISFINWLKENGTIYEDLLNYPVAYGPLSLVGVSAKEEINHYKAILFVPKKIIINSHEILNKSYLSLFFKHRESILFSKSNILGLTLFLIFEYLKGEKSFFKPYIDMMDADSPLFWGEDELELLDDVGISDAINYQNEEINEYYDNMKIFVEKFVINSNFKIFFENLEEKEKSKDREKEYEGYFSIIKEFSKLYLINIDINKFKLFYNFVLSRNFSVNDNISQLVPFADNLNHSEVDVYYEYFDSLNFVSKLTLEFDDDFISKIKKTNHDLFYKNIFEKRDKNEKYEKQIELVEKIIKEKMKEEEESYESKEVKECHINNLKITNDTEKIIEDDIIDFEESDYFTICTGPKQIFSPNSQVYNFYGRYSNEYLISNYGFTKFLNKYDKLNFTMNYEKNGDLIFEKLIEYYFSKNYFIHVQFLVIKFNLKVRKICNKFIDFLRFLIVYEEMEDECELYKIANIKDKFDIDFEINVLNRALEILITSLTQKCRKFPIDEDIIELNDILNKKSKMSFEKLKVLKENSIKKLREYFAITFRITQKYIVLFHIKYLYLILKILNFSKINNVSVESSYESKYEDYETSDIEYDFNRKIIIKYFRHYKFNI